MRIRIEYYKHIRINNIHFILCNYENKQASTSIMVNVINKLK